MATSFPGRLPLKLGKSPGNEFAAVETSILNASTTAESHRLWSSLPVDCELRRGLHGRTGASRSCRRPCTICGKSGDSQYKHIKFSFLPPSNFYTSSDHDDGGDIDDDG